MAICPHSGFSAKRASLSWRPYVTWIQATFSPKTLALVHAFWYPRPRPVFSIFLPSARDLHRSRVMFVPLLQWASRSLVTKKIETSRGEALPLPKGRTTLPDGWGMRQCNFAISSPSEAHLYSLFLSYTFLTSLYILRIRVLLSFRTFPPFFSSYQLQRPFTLS